MKIYKFDSKPQSEFLPAGSLHQGFSQLLGRPLVAIKLPKDATVRVQHDRPEIMGNA
jgi:hypothetical protein